MTSKEELINLIDTIRNVTGLKQKEIATKAGYTENTLAQAVSRDSKQEPVIKRLKLAFPEVLKNATLEDKEKTRRLHPVKTEVEENKELSIQTLYKLANANEMLAHSNKKLTDMLEQDRVNANAQEENQQVVPAILSGFRELLMEVALGRKFRSKQEVHALLNRVGPVVAQNNHVKDTQKG